MPLGYAPMALDQFIAFEVFYPEQFTVGVAKEYSFSVSRRAEGMRFRLKGANDTKFTLVFAVPIHERKFTLSIANSRPIPVEMTAE